MTELSRLLLRAGKTEPVPKGAEERALSALAHGGPGAATATAKAVSATFVKLLGGGLLGLSAWMAVSWAPTRPAASASPHPYPFASAVALAPVAASAEGTVAARAEGTVAARAEGAEGSSIPAPKPPTVRAPRTVSSSRPATPSLGAELELVREAKRRLAGGDPVGALRCVSRHDVVFPGGALTQEVAALRIEALLASGDRRGAARKAELFSSAYPGSPYTGRLTALLGETK